MKIIDKYQKILHNGVYIIQAIAYTISFLLISMSILRSSYTYISEYNDMLKAYMDVKLDLGESSALALSFILGVEILKLFYIKTYKQLIIVICLVAIKLIVSYFLIHEIENDTRKMI
jgi:uncharacterized membrane protein